jgi:hypothetical protein
VVELKPALTPEADMKESAIKEAESAISACEEETSVNISTDADIAYEAETANKA